MSTGKPLEKALALVQRLHRRTHEGKVDWEPTDSEHGVAARLEGFRLTLRQISDPDYPDQPDFELAIIDENLGTTIERITNSTLRPVMDRTTEEGLNPYTLMQQTFEIARWRAFGVDNALETILKGLAAE